MDRMPRRFTILDAVVLTAALAAAIASIRSRLPDTVATLSKIRPSRITESHYVNDVLLGRPPASRIDSIRLLMASSMSGVLGLPSRAGRGMPPRGQALI